MRKQGGIALLEVLIAVVILGIGLLGTIGLQARAYSALSDAGQRAEATIAADRLLGIMNNDTANLAAYAVAAGAAPGATLKPWMDETKAAIPTAVVGVNVIAEPMRVRVEIDIGWKRKANEMESHHRVTSYIKP